MVADPSRWRTRFGRWVMAHRVDRLARDLSQHGTPVTSHAIYDWVAARRAPRPVCAVAIVQISRGALSFDDIYRHRTEMQAISTSAGGRRGSASEPSN